MRHSLNIREVDNHSGEQLPLVTPSYRDAYLQIRNYLAGRFLGATRDEILLQEVIKCIFCKTHLARSCARLGSAEDPLELSRQYRQAFAELRGRVPAIFGEHDELLLDPISIAYIEQKLETIQAHGEDRDPFADVYESFIGNSIRGQEGQFFTPQNAVDLLVSVVAPMPGEKIIDPACGSGSFLSAAARRLIGLGSPPENAADDILGVDKDQYLVDLAASRLSLATLNPSKVYCADSLAWTAAEGLEFALKNEMGKFDVVLTNPPFGARIIAVSKDVQKLYSLGHKWKLDSHTGKFSKLQQLQSSVPPQVLFVERCIQLVRHGGRVGMVVPESLISGKNYRYVVDYIRNNAEVRAVIGMPDSLFKTSGKGGTHTKTCLLFLQKKDRATPVDQASRKIFMAEALWCGRDSRGREIPYDELPEIQAKYREFEENILQSNSHLGYEVLFDQLSENVLAPRYYNPDVSAELSALCSSHDLVKFEDLVSSGLIEITTGNEIGKLNYGSGSIPFVRTSDISNWEIKADPKHCVSHEIYESVAPKQDVKEGDILMVRDGTYLIGTCALITKYDTKIVFQSHLYKLRVTRPEELSPYLLLAILNCAPVQKQIKAKRFTQDIIDSLGDRINELVLPIPKSESLRRRVTETVRKAIHDRIEARELARKACADIVGLEPDK